MALNKDFLKALSRVCELRLQDGKANSIINLLAQADVIAFGCSIEEAISTTISELMDELSEAGVIGEFEQKKMPASSFRATEYPPPPPPPPPPPKNTLTELPIAPPPPPSITQIHSYELGRAGAAFEHQAYKKKLLSVLIRARSTCRESVSINSEEGRKYIAGFEDAIRSVAYDMGIDEELDQQLEQ